MPWRLVETCFIALEARAGAGFQLSAQDVPELRRRMNSFAKHPQKETDLEISLEIDAELRLSDLEQDVSKKSKGFLLSDRQTRNPSFWLERLT